MLTVEEFAAARRIGRSAAYELVRRNEVPHLKLGRRIRIPRHALAAMLGQPDGAEPSPAGSSPVGSDQGSHQPDHGAQRPTTRLRAGDAV